MQISVSRNRPKIRLSTPKQHVSSTLIVNIYDIRIHIYTHTYIYISFLSSRARYLPQQQKFLSGATLKSLSHYIIWKLHKENEKNCWTNKRRIIYYGWWKTYWKFIHCTEREVLKLNRKWCVMFGKCSSSTALVDTDLCNLYVR